LIINVLKVNRKQ